jgi:isopentenyl diphosphate isomerase/L-lactate dehydrogenase-like FMN-dependent dehydrogenase
MFVFAAFEIYQSGLHIMMILKGKYNVNEKRKSRG